MLPQLPSNFHDACLRSVSPGPRAELTLELDLHEPHKPRQTVHLRFGAITNFDTVLTYCAALAIPTLPGAYIARVDRIAYETNEPFTSGRLIIAIELDGQPKLTIHCRKIAIRERDQQNFAQL